MENYNKRFMWNLIYMRRGIILASKWQLIYTKHNPNPAEFSQIYCMLTLFFICSITLCFLIKAYALHTVVLINRFLVHLEVFSSSYRSQFQFSQMQNEYIRLALNLCLTVLEPQIQTEHWTHLFFHYVIHWKLILTVKDKKHLIIKEKFTQLD